MNPPGCGCAGGVRVRTPGRNVERKMTAFEGLKRFGGMGLLVAGLGLALAGCGEKDTRPQVAAILFQEDEFFRLVEKGMEEAAAEADVRLLLSNSSNSLEREISLVDTYAARGVDAIAVAPLSVDASVPALKRAHDAGIAVVTFDSPLRADFPSARVTSDQASLGRTTGEAARRYIEEELGGKAKIALIEYISLAPETGLLRVQGFKEVMEQMPGVEIVTEQDAWLAPQATDVVTSLLTAYPDVNLVWAANEGGTVGSVMAVRGAGKVGQVVVFGTDMSVQIADFLLADDGVLQAATGQKPFDIGKQTLDSAVRAMRGEEVEKEVSLPGILFTRDDPDHVREYRGFLEEISR